MEKIDNDVRVFKVIMSNIACARPTVSTNEVKNLNCHLFVTCSLFCSLSLTKTSGAHKK